MAKKFPSVVYVAFSDDGDLFVTERMDEISELSDDGRIAEYRLYATGKAWTEPKAFLMPITQTEPKK